MGKSGAIFAAICVLTCVVACSGSAADPPATSAPTSTTAQPTTSKPPTTTTAKAPFTPTVSPAKVTAACPFLSGDEILQAMDTTGDLLGAEQPSDPTFVPGTQFQCRYGHTRSNGQPLNLYIVASARAFAPAKSLENFKKDCAEPATPVPGAGDVAFYCDQDTAWAMVAVGKRSHGQNRTALLYLLRDRNNNTYITLAKILGTRL